MALNRNCGIYPPFHDHYSTCCAVAVRGPGRCSPVSNIRDRGLCRIAVRIIYWWVDAVRNHLGIRERIRTQRADKARAWC